jgi:hypothetical protein
MAVTVKKVEVKESLRNVTPDEEYISPTRAEEKVVAPPPVTAPVVEFVIVDNETKVDDNLEIFDSEANAKTSIDVRFMFRLLPQLRKKRKKINRYLLLSRKCRFPGA